MIFVSGLLSAQRITPVKSNLLLLQLQPKPSFTLVTRALKLLPQPSISKALPFLSPDYYARQLGFFCKQEIKFDKVTKIPIRFRLGSVEQCDRFEGKGRGGNY